MLSFDALLNVGDGAVGQWEEWNHRRGQHFHHLRRRLTPGEVEAAGIIALRDIRGTMEERERLILLMADMPNAAWPVETMERFRRLGL